MELCYRRYGVQRKKQFIAWWRGLPRFSYEFDMQAIVALAYQAGRKKGKDEVEEFYANL
jgi:hypothetical protein